MDVTELDMRQPVEEAALRMKYETLEKKKRTIHSCCYCSEEFRFVQKYHEHLENNHGIKTNKRKRYSLGACPVCGKIFMSQENLKLHISTHNEENSFICAVESCAAAFKCKRYIIRHIKKYHSMLANRKEVCKKSDSTLEKNAVSSMKCDACHCSFSTPFEYGAHKKKCNLFLIERENLGSNEEDLSRSRSQSVILAPITIESRPRVHRKKKLLSVVVNDERGHNPCYPCTLCGKIYQTKKSLYKHVKWHDGVVYRYTSKARKCTICDKSVTNLSAHYSEVHEDSRHFPCSFCDKTFKRKLHMEVHVRSHTGEKPYGCFFCEKKFAQPGDRNKHVKSSHSFKKSETSSEY